MRRRCCLIHGLRDETVRPKNSRNLAAALQSARRRGDSQLYTSALRTPARWRRSARWRSARPTLADIAAFVRIRASPQAALERSPRRSSRVAAAEAIGEEGASGRFLPGE